MLSLIMTVCCENGLWEKNNENAKSRGKEGKQRSAYFIAPFIRDKANKRQGFPNSGLPALKYLDQPSLQKRSDFDLGSMISPSWNYPFAGFWFGSWKIHGWSYKISCQEQHYFFSKISKLASSTQKILNWRFELKDIRNIY